LQPKKVQITKGFQQPESAVWLYRKSHLLQAGPGAGVNRKKERDVFADALQSRHDGVQ